MTDSGATLSTSKPCSPAHLPCLRLADSPFALRSKSFNESIQEACDPVVAATIELYNSIRVELLPTPSKSHYTFNLRDLSKVVQGCMRADARTTSDTKQVCLAYALPLDPSPNPRPTRHQPSPLPRSMSDRTGNGQRRMLRVAQALKP